MVNLRMATPDPVVIERRDRTPESGIEAEPASLTFQVKNLSMW